jgi:DNA uptake protein ComE-like DNA-binding protein
MLHRIRPIYALIVGVLLLLGLTACDNGDSAPTSTQTLPAAVGATATLPAADAAATSPAAADASGSAAATPTAASVQSEASPTAAAATESTASTGGSTVEASCTLLNLNTLTEDQLMSTIPNFSSRMVREFFEYRPYASIQEFRQEIGKYVGAEQVAEYEKYVYVPVDPNASDAETLKQIPGVDDTGAATLVSARPYASNEAFIEALSSNLSEEQAAQAQCYLVTP